MTPTSRDGMAVASGDGAAGALAARVVRALREDAATVVTAESLTGGLVAAALTDVPGASAVLLGGVVAYAAEVKRDVLGVPQEVIDRHGTVSRECALAMTAGARRLTGADWAVATTGVAGPDPSEGHPVGTVHVAVAGESIQVHRALHLDGDRTAVRLSTVEAALKLLQEALRSGPSAPEGTVETSHDGTDDAEEG